MIHTLLHDVSIKNRSLCIVCRVSGRKKTLTNIALKRFPATYFTSELIPGNSRLSYFNWENTHRQIRVKRSSDENKNGKGDIPRKMIQKQKKLAHI